MTGKALNAKMVWAQKLKLSSEDDFFVHLCSYVSCLVLRFAFAPVCA